MDQKVETVERLIKAGHISLYEGLALLDWGKIEAKADPEPETGEWVVVYGNLGESIQHCLIFDDPLDAKRYYGAANKFPFYALCRVVLKK